MLITKTVINHWNSRNKTVYVNLGYKFTKMREPFEMNVQDLVKGSNILVDVKCDYCGRQYTTTWYEYNRNRKGIILKDCCGNSYCTGEKAQETIMKKYGVKSCMLIPEIKEKAEQTNLKKYGSRNPFSSDIIKEKIKDYNIRTYGGNSSTCSNEVIEKIKKTCIEKYGVENYSQTAEFKNMFKGNKNPQWKGGNRKTIRTEREHPEYREWRFKVFCRDHFTCQICGEKNYNGRHKTLRLECHHLNCFKDFPNERCDVDNGITLCESCHKKFHSIYGIKHTTKEQFEEFKTDKKIC